MENKTESMYIEISFDGACEPKNPGGAMGLGVQMLVSRADNKEDVKTICREAVVHVAAPENTNNVAEYLALIKALDLLRSTIELMDIKEAMELCVLIFGDSQLVIKQMNGEFAIREGSYVPYAHEAKLKAGALSALVKTIEFKHVKREKNEDADKMSVWALKWIGVARNSWRDKKGRR